MGEKVCNTPEEFKAWSQNLGHEQVMTTFFSYGEVDEGRQADIITNLKINDSSLSSEEMIKIMFEDKYKEKS